MARISERTNPDISAARGHIRYNTKKPWLNYVSLLLSVVALLKAYHVI